MSLTKGVAVIGGGRWARVIAEVLDSVVLGDSKFVAVSPSNPERWRNWIKSHPRWHVGQCIKSVLSQPEISHVVIARNARNHAETCLAALEQGKSVLVEKPFCLTLADLEKIILASQNKHAFAALVFHFGPNQVAFRNACMARGAPKRLVLEWVDPTHENRHGESKTYDSSLNVVQDVFPHAWSILRPFLENEPLRLCNVTTDGGGRSVTLELAAGATSISMRLQRDAERRARLLYVDGIEWQAEFDFSVEPGLAMIDGVCLDVSEDFSSPLAAMLQAFLVNEMPQLAQLEVAQELIRLSVSSIERLRILQANAIILGSHPSASVDNIQAAQYALREISAGGITGDGQSIDQQQIASWATSVVQSSTV